MPHSSYYPQGLLSPPSNPTLQAARVQSPSHCALHLPHDRNCCLNLFYPILTSSQSIRTMLCSQERSFPVPWPHLSFRPPASSRAASETPRGWSEDMEGNTGKTQLPKILRIERLVPDSVCACVCVHGCFKLHV